jgi:hypothetical protein
VVGNPAVRADDIENARLAAERGILRFSNMKAPSS